MCALNSNIVYTASCVDLESLRAEMHVVSKYLSHRHAVCIGKVTTNRSGWYTTWCTLDGVVYTVQITASHSGYHLVVTC